MKELNKEELYGMWQEYCNRGDNIKYKYEEPITQKPVIINKKKYKKYNTTLVVPDAHTTPDQDFSRFKALGNFADEKRPDQIIFMGDFCNFDSLSSYDYGKENSHGKRYKDDCKAGIQALKLFKDQLSNDYNPTLIFLGGNHDEGRVEKYIESHAQLRGHMDIKEDLRLDELGFEYIPYKMMYESDGVLYTHAIMNAANMPVSGKNVMNTISHLTAKSVVVGHHHRFETMGYFRHGADDIQQVLLCGLFSEHTDNYADGGCNAYSRCVCILTHTGPGRFDVEQVSIERLKREFL